MENNIRKAMLHVDMPDGSVWGILVSSIAYNRASYYAKEYDGNVARSLNEDTWPLFEMDAYEIRDWAENNMNWIDVREGAVLIEDARLDAGFQEGWVNGAKEIVYNDD